MGHTVVPTSVFKVANKLSAAALSKHDPVRPVAVPWITPRTDDGRYLFGALDPVRQGQCLAQRRCQVCGRGLGRRLILLLRLVDLPRQRTSEPALEPVCAAYTQTACPMVDLREFAISEACFGANSSDAGIAKQSNDAWVQEPAPFVWPSPRRVIDDDSGNAG